MDRVNVAVVGCGRFGEVHAATYAMADIFPHYSKSLPLHVTLHRL